MNEKLKRPYSYTVSDSKLSHMEWKEKYLPPLLGYYKMRALANLISVNYFGTKDTIKRNIEHHLFENKDVKIPSREELASKYELELYEKDGGVEKAADPLITCLPGYRSDKIAVTDFIPEINNDSRKLISYPEVYNTLFRFT